jgi:hypothetical protein
VPEIKSFTFSSEVIMRELPCEVSILAADLTNPEEGKKAIKARGIWDTGASGSAITAEIAKSLGLKPVSMVDMHTAGGIKPSNVYIVDILLPNDIHIQNVEVTEADMVTQDVLIGMDIITLGDFALTNFGGKSRFTFSIPSTRNIDFVQELKRKGANIQHGGQKNKGHRKLEKRNRKSGRNKR